MGADTTRATPALGCDARAVWHAADHGGTTKAGRTPSGERLVRTLSLVPVGTTGDVVLTLRTWRFLDLLRRLGPVDLVAAGPMPAPTAARWADRLDGRVVAVPAVTRDPLPPWWRLQRPRLPRAVVGTRSGPARRALAELIDQAPEPIGAVWCADPLVMAQFGRVRRDIALLLDVPDPFLPDPTDPRGLTDPVARPWPARAAEADDRARLLRFSRYWAAASHVATVGDADRRERLGVPGVLVVASPDRPSTVPATVSRGARSGAGSTNDAVASGPPAPVQVDRFLERVVEMIDATRHGSATGPARAAGPR